MNKMKKILIITIIITILSTIIMPIVSINVEKIIGSSNYLWKVLNGLSHMAIVKAGDTDYEYEGNLYISWYEPGMYWAYDEEYNGVGVYIYKAWATPTLEYSVNGSEFKEFEVQDFGTYVLDLDKETNEIICREKQTQDIVYEALVIKKDDFYIVLHHATVGHNKGDYVYTIYADKDEDIEYSLDNGNTFYRIQNYSFDGSIPRTYWPNNNKVEEQGKMFTDHIIIRNSTTGETTYETPNIEELIEEYTYENGRTKVIFSAPNVNQNEVIYSYEIDGQSADGNEVTVEENTTMKLKAAGKLNFVNKFEDKEINVIVVKTNEPDVNIDEENNLEVTPGEIENDELEGIYYIVDEGEEEEYKEKLTLDYDPGEHTIRIYQRTTKGVISEIVEKSFTINENKEEENNSNTDNNSTDDKDEEKDTNENNDNKNGESENTDKNSNNENTDENKSSENNQENNIEENNNTKSDRATKNSKKETKNNQKKDNNMPKTGDTVAIFISIIFTIIGLNALMKSKKK